MYKQLMGDNNEDRLFPVVPSKRRQWAQTEIQGTPSESKKVFYFSFFPLPTVGVVTSGTGY